MHINGTIIHALARAAHKVVTVAITAITASCAFPRACYIEQTRFFSMLWLLCELIEGGGGLLLMRGDLIGPLFVLFGI